MRRFNVLPTILLALALCPSSAAQLARRNAHTPVAPERMADMEKVSTQLLPIRRVILYSNGVAYIERRGMVTGHAEIALSFKQSQVDDVLKSMIVLDLGRGRIGAVSYNSSAPPEARIADIPFNVAAQTAAGGLAGVLGQLQGAHVSVTTATRTATGAILTVEERRTQIDASKPPVITHALVIASAGGELMSFDLADVRGVKLLDEGARRDVTEFAQATASARRRDAKTIVVTSDGTSAREMVVSYTLAAPIWKTTYRVVLDEGGKPFFQGWAIVDNVSEEDWRDVELSLISGTPVSFIQPLQQPFYRYRPVVPIPDDLQLNPQTYEPGEGTGDGTTGALSGTITDPNGAVVAGATVTITNNANGQQVNVSTTDEGKFTAQSLSAGIYNITVSAQGFKQLTMQNVSVSANRVARLNLSIEVGSVAETVTITGGVAESGRNIVADLAVNGRRFSNLALMKPGAAPRPTLSEALTSGASGVTADTQAAEVGADLFEYRIAQPVTLLRDRSALIPILQTRMTGERVSIYNDAARGGRPMSGLLLKNDSPLTLESGALTIIDGNAYAGEALMERLKPGEERLISFALDLGTLVRAEEKGSDTPAFLVRIGGGVLQAHYYQQAKKTYTLTNQTDRPRVVYIEHPVRSGWELDTKNTPAPTERTARYYRFRVELPAHERKELAVVERRSLLNTYVLANFSPADLTFFFTQRYIDEPTRAALQRLLDLKARVAALAARLQAINAEVAQIGEDQKRLRDNISALKSTVEAKQLIARYVAKADEQETRIEQLTKERQTVADERQRAQAELDAAIRALDLERKLTE